jgi:hypothetical protein
LFTDPINEAPVVTIDQPSGPVVSGDPDPVGIVGRATDDQDSESSLVLHWKEFDFPKNQVCSSITPADWVGIETPLPSGASYPFSPTSTNTVCVCALVTDHNGASSFKCLALTPSNPPPVATIVDASIPSFASGKPRPLCSQVHLSAEQSTIPLGDTPTFTWLMDYEGNDSSSKLTDCNTGVTTNKDRHRCFSASAPGTYTVTLSIKDTYMSNGNQRTSDSAPVQFVVSVAPDAPACLQQTEPDIFAHTILLSRSSDLGSSYQSRTFVVDSVDDDCQPYPRTSSSLAPAQLVWSIWDGTGASPQWAYETTSANSLVISQSRFPNARPGDTVKLRVEARDTPTQKIYQQDPKYQSQLCPGDPDTCCSGGTGAGVCGSTACVRWTTWTVQFQP